MFGLRHLWRRMNATAEPALLFFEQSAVFRLLAIVGAIAGFFVLVATGYQIAIDLSDRAEERNVRKDESIARAWDRLLFRAGGNTGKGNALSLLLRHGLHVDGIDISCEAVGDWSAAEKKCTRSPIYTDVSVTGPDPADYERRVVIDNVNLRDAKLVAPLFDGVKITAADMRGADINEGQLWRSSWEADWSDARIRYSDIIDSYLGPDDKATERTVPKLVHVNVSGSILDWPELMTNEQLAELFAWADWPPYPRYGTVDLNAINLCLPPTDKAGSVTPKADRGSMFRLHPILGKRIPCKNISLAGAMSRFPEAYRDLGE